MYDDVYHMYVNNLKYASKIKWLRESGHYFGKTYALLEDK